MTMLLLSDIRVIRKCEMMTLLAMAAPGAPPYKSAKQHGIALVKGGVA